MTRYPRRGLLFVLACLAGCGAGSTSSTSLPLGRLLEVGKRSARWATAPSGDPFPERNGTISKSQTAREYTLEAGSAAPSPQAALRRYALAYTNWQADRLAAHERQLVFLAVGPARLAAEQTAASQGAADELAANHVENKGVLLAIMSGEGPAHGQWVVVTQEQTIGSGPYSGLPTSPHVTLAKTVRLRDGFAISQWHPQS